VTLPLFICFIAHGLMSICAYIDIYQKTAGKNDLQIHERNFYRNVLTKLRSLL
jgi:hypothetical protein